MRRSVGSLLVLAGVLSLAVSGMVGVPAPARAAEELPTYDIVLVGGEKAVNGEVFAALQGATSGNVVRVAGPDRYATAAAVSEIAAKPGAPVVFVATGEDFPDALVAGPVAARRGGSVVLVERDRVPEPTRRELERLEPQEVVALGGTEAISPGILDELAEITGAPTGRLSGPTRFSTAAAVSRAHYSPGVPLVYVATGLSFADALTGGPAGSVRGAPILLTGSTALPPSTRAELERLQPGGIAVLGGRAAVGESVEEELAAYTTGSVERIGGAGREGTATRISEHAFPSGAGVVFVATGADFPDALAIGAAAGAEPHNRFGLLGADPDAAGETPGPVLLTRPNSLPAETLAELARLGVTVPTPQAEDQQVETDFQTPVDITLEASGPGAAPLTFAVTSPPQHGSLIGTAPDLTYTPDGGFTGTDTFEFTASLGAITSDPATVTVTVHPPPVPTADDQSVSTPFETAVGITLTGSAPSGLPTTFAIDSGPSDGTLSGTGQNRTYTPDGGFFGTDSFTFTVSDGIGTSAPATVTVTVDDPPVPLAHDVSADTPFEMAVVITLDGQSPSGHPLTYTVVDQPDNGTAVVIGDGPDVTYTPDPGFEADDDTFTYRVNDGFNDSNVATVTVSVEPQPPTAADVTETVDQDDSVVVTLDANSTSGQPLTYHYDQPSDGTVTGTGPEVTYTPDPGFHGTDTFDYHVNDGFNDSNTATVTVTVDPLEPVAHDQTVQVPKNALGFEITLGADNPSGGPLTFTIVDDPDDGTANVVGTGPDVTYTPDAGFEGDDSFTFEVNDGFNDSNTATVTLEVRPAPPEAQDVSATTDQDAPVVITLDADNFSNNPLTFHYDQPSDGTVTGAGPDVTYTPDPGFFGTDSFTFHVNDGFNDSNTATVTVTVEPLAPVANDVSADTAFETAVVITLDGDSLSGEPLTYEIVDDPGNGTAVLIDDGPDVTYTPDPGFEADDDTFTYRVNDGHNDSNTATVTVSVEPAPPTAADVDAETAEDTPVVITLDGNSSSGQPLTYHYGQPSDGTVTGAGPDVTYTPDPGFFGEDEFTYHVNDGFNDSNTATVTVTVNFNAEDYDFDAVGNTLLEVGVAASGDPAVTVSASLLDDAPDATFWVDDVDTSGSSGTVTWDSDGTFTYEPAAGFTGDDTFVYTISDGTFSGSGTVTVTVADVVWYVDGEASGDGRSWSPFATLAEAEADSGTGDVIFVYEGAAAYSDGITLQQDQSLLGEEVGLSIGGHDLVDPGDRPVIDAGGDDAIVLASGTHVEGIDVTGGLRGLVAEGAGGTVTVTDVDVSGTTSNAVHLAGPGDFTLTGVDVTNSGGSAFFVHSTTGTVSHDGTITQSGTSAAVTVEDTVLGSDVSLGPVTSAASGISVSTSAGDVEIASASLGSPGTRVSGAGLAVSASGTVTVGSLTAYTQGGAAVSGDSSSSVSIEGGSADTQGAPVISMNNTGADIELATATSSASTGDGLALSGVTGSVDIAGGSVTGAAGTAVLVSGGSVDLTAGVSVTNSAGNAVNVAGLSGGSVTLSGAITDTGDGIALTTNSGSTIAFSGALDIETIGSVAFRAVGGGTVTATATGSTLDATGARALQVESTSIGAAGLAFDEVSASGAVHGIQLAGTGSGPLVVAGDGSDNRNGLGGVISGMSSHGVTFTNTGPVTLRNMTIDENDHTAVRAEGVAGLTLVAALIENNTTSGAGTQNSLFLRDLSGTVLIEDTVVNGSAHNQIDVEQTSGSVTVELLRTVVHENDNNFGLFAVARNDAELTLHIDDSTFFGNNSYAVHVQSLNTADVTVSVMNSDFEDNHVSVHLAAWGNSTMHSTVTGITAEQHSGHVMIVAAVENSLHEAVISDNTVNASGSTGYGIDIAAEDAGRVRALVEDNTITDVDNIFAGLRVRAVEADGVAEAHVVLTGNDVTATDSLSSGFDLGAFGGNHVCAAISGNTAVSGGSGEGMWVETVGTGSSFQVEGMTPGPVTPAEVEAHLTAQNPGLDGVDAFAAAASDGFEGVAAGTCERPS